MAKITAAQVKELRDKTGVGMMDAKKALVAVEGDMEKAIDFLREKGIAKAAKKSDRVAAEGLADVEVVGNTAAIVEINAETDFVAQNQQFKDLVKNIATAIAKNKPADLEAALAIKSENGSTMKSLKQRRLSVKKSPFVVSKSLKNPIAKTLAFTFTWAVASLF